jgi:hypothetical protein
MEVTLNETDRLEGVLKRFRREITKAGLASTRVPPFNGGARARLLAAGNA